MHRALLATLIAFGVLVPAASAAVGPDYVSSDNLELVDRIKTVGDGVGGRIVGDYLYVTSTKSLSIFDIKTDPEHPAPIGVFTLDVEFENEEVPTNGKILGMSGQQGCANPLGAVQGCLTLYDVTDPANIKRGTSIIGAGDHVSACVFDCKFMMGSEGSVSETTDINAAKEIGNWEDGITSAPGAPEFKTGCHALREITPGIVLGSCQPIVLMSIRPEDGASVLTPKVLATATNQDERFIHSSRWPGGGTDKFLLVGGETNAEPVCNDTVGSFMVWDASAVGSAAKPNAGSEFKLLDEIRPINGNYADGHSPVNGLGCSVHWFQERPGFKNGGAVANAQYENGVRILQITPEGKIVEQGFFLPLGGSTSSPLWNPNGKVIYSIDYARGVDVLRYTGPSYVPDANGVPSTEPGTTPGTDGPGPGGDAAPCASAAGFKDTPTKPSGGGLRFAPTFRQSNPYDVDVFQQSEKRRVLGNRLRARFRGKKGTFTWKGSSKLTPGNYFVRYSMKLADGNRDVRRITFAYKKKRFKGVKDFYQRTDCGIFSRYKLGSSVFGGKTKAPLGISYRLARGADSVSVVVKAGKKTIQTFKGSGAGGKTVRFSIPATKVKRGKTVSVTTTAKVSGTTKSQTLYAKRL